MIAVDGAIFEGEACFLDEVLTIDKFPVPFWIGFSWFKSGIIAPELLKVLIFASEVISSTKLLEVWFSKAPSRSFLLSL